jgi:hypothetical protein
MYAELIIRNSSLAFGAFDDAPEYKRSIKCRDIAQERLWKLQPPIDKHRHVSDEWILEKGRELEFERKWADVNAKASGTYSTHTEPAAIVNGEHYPIHSIDVQTLEMWMDRNREYMEKLLSNPELREFIKNHNTENDEEYYDMTTYYGFNGDGEFTPNVRDYYADYIRAVWIYDTYAAEIMRRFHAAEKCNCLRFLPLWYISR